MALRSFPLHHRIYAHEDSPGKSGGKIVPLGELDARRVVPEATLRGLDQLLESITPEGDGSAYAVQRSLIPEAIGSFACLIVCHSSHRDGIERPAAVTHARVVRIDSGDAWLDIDALIKLAGELDAGVLRSPLDGDLTRFLVGNESTIDIARWNVARFEDVPRPFSCDVAGACLSRWSRNEAVFHVEPRDSIELLSDIAAAWSVLPLYAQLASPFSLHAQRGARVKALFSTHTQGNDSEVSKNLKRWVAEYVDWVHERPDDVRLLTEDREIRDLKTLEDRFRALTARAGSVESVPRTAGGGAMRRQGRPAAPERARRRGGLDQDVVTFINKQVRSAEDSLRDYVDRRVGTAGASQRMAGARGGSSDASLSASIQERMRRWLPRVLPVAASVVGISLIVMFVYLVMNGRARDARLTALEKHIAALEPVQTARPHGSSSAQGQQATELPRRTLIPATELPGDGWAVRFQGLGDRDPQRLGAIVNAIVRGEEENAMPPETAKLFAKIREALSAGGKLEKTDRALLRTLLVQCIADQTARQDDPNVAFDGRFAGIPKSLLTRVRDQLHVTSKPGNKEQTADFEAEVILRWAKEKGL
jgi:hypothetical protein